MSDLATPLSLDPSSSRWQIFQVEIKTHSKVAGAALLVAGMVYLIWGKFHAILCVGAFIFAFVKYGPVIKVLNNIDLKGVTLATAAFVAPFFGGIPAYLAGALVGMSVLAHEWEQLKICEDLERQREDLKEQVSALTVLAQTATAVADVCQDRNKNLQKLGEDTEARSQAMQELDQRLKGQYTQMRSKLQNILTFFETSEGKTIADEMQAFSTLSSTVEGLRLEHTRLQAEIDILTAQQRELNDRRERTNDRLENVVTTLGHQSAVITTVVEQL